MINTWMTMPRNKIGFYILGIGAIALAFGGCQKTRDYTCFEGTHVKAVFSREKVLITLQDKSFELPQIAKHGEARYSDGKITFGLKKGTAYVLEGDQMIDYGCTEK